VKIQPLSLDEIIASLQTKTGKMSVIVEAQIAITAHEVRLLDVQLSAWLETIRY